MECLDYQFILARFHGIKYNKLSQRKDQKMRGKKVLLKHIQTWHFLMSITIKSFASPSIKARMPPVNQSESHNNRSRKNETKKSSSFRKALAAFLAPDNIYNAHMQAQGIYRWCVAYITMLHLFLKLYSPSGRNYTNKAFQATEAQPIFVKVILKC